MKTLLALFCLLPTLCFSQGFGSFKDDQPFLAKDNLASSGNPPYYTNLIYWWHAEDITDGTVTGWTDSISGLVLSMGNAALQPVKASNYVTFASSQLTNLDSTAFNTTTRYVYLFVLNIKSTAAQFIWSYKPTLYPTLAVEAVQSLRYRLDGTTYTVVSNPCPINAIMDVGLSFNGHHSNLSNYVNGVYTGTANPYYALDYNQIAVGARTTGLDPLDGDMYDILVYTNVVNNLDAFFSDCHNWRTNKYGGSP